MNKAKNRWVDKVTVFSVLCNQSTFCFRIQIGVIDGKKHANCVQKSNPGDLIKINVIKVQKQYEADHSIAQLKDSEHRNYIQSYFSAIQ